MLSAATEGREQNAAALNIQGIWAGLDLKVEPLNSH